MLLGDSIFDNGAYVAAGSLNVVRQVRQRLPHGAKRRWRLATGARRDVRKQLRRLPLDATHLVVSIGGNDALGSSDFLRPEELARRLRLLSTSRRYDDRWV